MGSENHDEDCDSSSNDTSGLVNTVSPLPPRLFMEIGLDAVFEGPGVRTTTSNILSNLLKNFGLDQRIGRDLRYHLTL